MNMKYLMEQTGMSAEEINKLLDAKGQNINSINGSNIDSHFSKDGDELKKWYITERTKWLCSINWW